jgi:hypothetical protein
LKKSWLKTIKKLFLIGLAIGILVVASFDIYLENSINTILSPELQEKVFDEINNSPDLPEKFYEVIDKYYPEYFHRGVWEVLLNGLFLGKHYKTPCTDIYFYGLSMDRKQNYFSDYILRLEIEEQCSPKACYNFLMNNAELGMNTKGVNEAAKFYFKKELNDLTDWEILTLHLLQIASTKYNPILNKEFLDEALDKIMKVKK